MIHTIYDSQKGNSKCRGHVPPSYTKKWLVEFMLSDSSFHELYDTWELSGYDKGLRPSIDRLDDYVGYTEDNIHITTWRANSLRSNEDMKNGINNKQSREVSKYTLAGKFVCIYHSVNHACRENKLGITSIVGCCKGVDYQGNKRLKSGGFQWRYTDSIGCGDIDSVLPRTSKSGHTGVTKNGKRWRARVDGYTVGSYDTIEEAVVARNKYIKDTA